MNGIEDDQAKLGLPRRTKVWVGAGVVVLMIGMAVALVNALAPNFTAAVREKVLSTITVTITAPETPPPPPQAKPRAAGDEGAAGKKALPKEAKAPPTKLPISKPTAPAVASSGMANTSGAVNQGVGTGGGAQGSGPGAGGTGSGQGGGKPTKAEHIGGAINNAKDFPIPPGGREARVGKSVILALTVAPSGRATACRVYKSSGLPETDAIACTLAIQRLRFKPATNAAGEPVSSTFYWQQKFFF